MSLYIYFEAPSAGVAGASVAEAATAADSESASVAFVAATTEAATATDTPSAFQGSAATLTESAHAADTSSASMAFSGSGSSSESGSSSDASSASQGGGPAFTGTIVEYADAIERPEVTGRQVTRMLHSTGLTRHELVLFTAPSGNVYAVRANESASALDAVTGDNGEPFVFDVESASWQANPFVFDVESASWQANPFVFDTESATWQPRGADFAIDMESASFVGVQPCRGCPNYDIASAFAHCCPGVIMDRDIEAGLLLAYQAGGCKPLDCGQILAIVLPLMPEGNPPQYVNGCPPNFPFDQPGATPLFLPALPPQPNFTAAAIGDAYLSATVPVFQKGLPRFEDSNPEPFDGWAIDNPGWYSGGG